MAASSPPTPVGTLTARKTWRTAEPLHGMIYFAPEAATSYARLGMRQEAGYFASRSAPMGALGAGAVTAAFFNFNPRLVADAMEGVWDATSPAEVLEARLDAADAALRRMLGDATTGPEMERAAVLARRAAERAAERCEGRPLFAGHAGLDWPRSPHLVLWHAQTLLREFRGDGHVAALLTHGIGPVEALAMHAASGEVPTSFLKGTRGWSDDEWDAGVDQLRRRGWLAETPPAGGGGPALSLSGRGRDVRQEVEDVTDCLAVHPYEALGEDGCAELRTLTRPFSRIVVDAAGLPA